MIIRSKSGQIIRSVEQWFQHAPPRRGKEHWKDYRSAKELAKAYFRPRLPEEVASLLRTHPDFADFVADEAVAEYAIKLDDFGGDRNADLLLLGRTSTCDAVVTIEAKADEVFADLTGVYHDKMMAEPRSNLPTRVARLSEAIFGRPLDHDIRQLRYQLLHSAAATLIEAKNRKARIAAFVVHEFLSAHTKSEKVATNEKDWAYFLSLLGHSGTHGGSLIGPIKVAGGGRIPEDIPLYVGKVTVYVP